MGNPKLLLDGEDEAGHLPGCLSSEYVSVYVSVLVCMYICVYLWVSACVCMCLCVNVSLCVRMCSCTCLCICVHVYVSVCLCKCVCMYICDCVYICVHLHIYVCVSLCIFVYVSVYVHVCVHVCLCTHVSFSICLITCTGCLHCSLIFFLWAVYVQAPALTWSSLNYSGKTGRIKKKRKSRKGREKYQREIPLLPHQRSALWTIKKTDTHIKRVLRTLLWEIQRIQSALDSERVETVLQQHHFRNNDFWALKTSAHENFFLLHCAVISYFNNLILGCIGQSVCSACLMYWSSQFSVYKLVNISIFIS